METEGKIRMLNLFRCSSAENIVLLRIILME